MQRRCAIAATVMIAVAALGGEACKPAAARNSDTTRLNPDAMKALAGMGDYLRSLKAFEVKADVTRENVLENGQKVQIASRISAVAQKPNRLRVQLASDRKQRLFFYDGKTFTMFAPRQNFYATVKAPRTIGELAKVLEEKYAIELPFVDLFRWGTSDAQMKAITNATDIGASECSGATCEQYAFRQDGLDWQVWIQQGEYPLPRKLVLTTLTDDARPQYSATYTWNLAPSFDKTSFVFTPPSDAKKITIADVQAMRQAEADKTKGGSSQ